MGLKLLDLADNFSCYTSGEKEARVIYREIFEDHTYDKLELSKSPVIVDVGANIGLFSIYMKKKYPLARIIAFEPSPETFDALRRNLALHNASETATYPCGLGSKASMATLTYYPEAHGNSTFFPEEKEIQRPVVIEHWGQSHTDEMFGISHKVSVPVNTLSHFLQSYHPEIKQIDYLKVDVEGAELQVLKGIDDDHWKMVQNIGMEIGDALGDLDEAEKLMQSKGFEVTRENADWAPEELKMYMLWGRRSAPLT